MQCTLDMPPESDTVMFHFYHVWNSNYVTVKASDEKTKEVGLWQTYVVDRSTFLTTKFYDYYCKFELLIQVPYL